MRRDALRSFFSYFFEQKGQIDIAPLKLEPTWRNKRGGDKAISKRLDRFMVAKNLVNEQLILQSMVEIGGNSDHPPIVLKIRVPEEKPPSPFKFNPQWLEEEDDKTLILKAGKPLREV